MDNDSQKLHSQTESDYWTEIIPPQNWFVGS